MWTDVLLIRIPLALWTGSGVAAGTLAAPVIFRESGSRDRAGRLFGAILRRLEAFDHALSAVLVIGIFTKLSRGEAASGRFTALAILAFFAIAANVYLSMVVRRRMEYFRSHVESFDTVPPDDPWRRKFDRLHRRSERIALLGLLCAAAALTLAP
jgi:hypothetical protein